LGNVWKLGVLCLCAKGTVCFCVPKGFLPLTERKVRRCLFYLTHRKGRESRKNVQIVSVVFTRTVSERTSRATYAATQATNSEGDKDFVGHEKG
jgi:hypothetical protein